MKVWLKNFQKVICMQIKVAVILTDNQLPFLFSETFNTAPSSSDSLRNTGMVRQTQTGQGVPLFFASVLTCEHSISG